MRNLVGLAIGACLLSLRLESVRAKLGAGKVNTSVVALKVAGHDLGGELTVEDLVDSALEALFRGGLRSAKGDSVAGRNA